MMATVGVGVGNGVGAWVGIGVFVGFGVFVGVGAGEDMGTSVRVGVAVRVCVEMGLGAAAPDCMEFPGVGGTRGAAVSSLHAVRVKANMSQTEPKWARVRVSLCMIENPLSIMPQAEKDLRSVTGCRRGSFDYRPNCPNLDSQDYGILMISNHINPGIREITVQTNNRMTPGFPNGAVPHRGPCQRLEGLTRSKAASRG